MKPSQYFFHGQRWLVPMVLLSIVVACGGGGGGGDSTPSSGGSGPTAITGTAATGAAIAGGNVHVKCANGALASGTTATDGSFSLNLVDAQAPCLLSVAGANGLLLHSLATGSGAGVVANITPVTELLVASLGAGAPATVFGSFGAGNAGAVSAAAVADAAARLLAKLKTSGVDLTGLPDPVTGNLVIGGPADLALDALQARFAASGTTLADLVATVVTEAQALKDPAATSGVASLPAELRLLPAAANCAALRSGVYRVVELQSGIGWSVATGTITANASTLTLSNGTITWSWTANGNCRFSGSTGEDIVASQAGVIVSRDHDVSTDPFHLTIGFPEQAHTVAELAGTWAKLGFSRNSGNTAFVADAASVTLAANGVASAISYCANIRDCVPPVGQTVTVSLNVAGGYTRTFADGSTDRAFAYRAGGGELMLVTIAGDGSVGFWTRQRTFAFPTAGTTTASWDFETNSQSVSTATVATSTATVTSVDTAAGTFVREQSVGNAGATRTETLFGNNPRAGYRYRPGTPVPLSTGGTSTPREQVILQMRGMGVTPVAYPAAATFGLSVAPPSTP